MTHIRASIDYNHFRNSVLKSFFYGREEMCDKPSFFEVIDKAFDLACRNTQSHVSERYLFQEVLLYIRSGYHYLQHWC